MNVSDCKKSISDFFNPTGKLKSIFNDKVEYQRNNVWTKQDRQQAILSIFLNRLVMPIQVHVVKSGEREDIVDGKQRLHTISEFLSNKVSIPRDIDLIRFGLGIIKAGSLLEDLTDEQVTHFRTTKLYVVEITNATDAEIREYFLMQNAGKGLTSAEKRNAIDSIVRDHIVDNIAEHPTIAALNLDKVRFKHHTISAQIFCLLYDRMTDNKIGISSAKLNDFYETDARDDFKFDLKFKDVIKNLDGVLDMIEDILGTITPEVFQKIPMGLFITLVDVLNDGLVVNQKITDRLSTIITELRSKKFSSECVSAIHNTIRSASDSGIAIDKRKELLLLYLQE